MADSPTITIVYPVDVEVPKRGMIINGDHLNGDVTANTELFFQGESMVWENGTKFITSVAFDEIRFCAPNYIPGRYYVKVRTDGGFSNVF